MPIMVKDFTWSETKNEVQIVVPLKGVKASKVDIFSTDEYIKVSFPPFLFEVALLRPVVDEKSVGKIGDGTVSFQLVKREADLWGRLSSGDHDKGAMRCKREDAVTEAQRRSEEQEKAQAKEKQERDRAAVKEQMRLDAEDRERIQQEKDSERKEVTDDIEEWKNTQEVKASLESELTDKAPRQRGVIDVTFTPRVFPTPIRESKIPEEEAWLKKQAEARKIEDVNDPDLRPEEKDPVWLKAKADGFFKNGNHLSAVNAYNLAIRMNPLLPALHSNRSACHLKLGNYMKCIEDSSRALELLTPPVAANASSRLKAHIRRGTAFCHLELYVEGLLDYEAALKIDPKNADLIDDADKIRKIIQGDGCS